MTAPPLFGSIREYRSRLGDVGFWWAYVADVLAGHDLASAGREPVAGTGGTYPTFLCGDVVVKLFGYSRSWRVSHAAGRAAHHLLVTDPRIAAPRLLGEGRLSDDVDAPWPYLITTRMSGVASGRAELSAEQLVSIAAELGSQVRRVHALRPSGVATAADWPTLDVAAAAERSSLPDHLIAQIDDYLARLGPFDCVFVHGDLIANHVFVENGRLTGIIDWGDAMVTDRHYELIQLYRDMFGCDKSLLRVSWRPVTGRSVRTFPGKHWVLRCTARQSVLPNTTRWTSSSPSQLCSRSTTSALSTNSQPRAHAAAELRNRDVRCLFTVDLFNEGVDLPDVDTLLLLRPTSSATLFLQQLGRGLRRAPGKALLTVLDFIGQHRREYRFDLRYRALTGTSRSRLRQEIERGFPFLPSGSQLVLDRVARDIVLDNVRAALSRSRRELIADLRSHGDLPLASFLADSGRELADVYGRAGQSWTRLRREAGFPTLPAGPHEDTLLRRVVALSHVNDPERAALYTQLVSPDGPSYGSLAPHEQAVARMLFFTVWPDRGDFASYADGLARLRAHPAVAANARVVADVELPEDRWRPLDPDRDVHPRAVTLFVDGGRRIDARVWVNEPADRMIASPALCASYAAGVVCCCAGQGAHLLAFDVRRGLFTTAAHAVDIPTTAGTYGVSLAEHRSHIAPIQALSLALQARLGDTEINTAVTARAALVEHGLPDGGDLLVIDGPLRGRQHLPRALGYIKSHRSGYLPSHLHGLVASLSPGQRTPVFLLGSSWDRYTWYLRLPCTPGAPWAGIVRLECSAALHATDAIGMAWLSQATLCRYASVEYKDTRAPQNLYPIAGLERQLRRRLGDVMLLYRGLRSAGTHP